MGNNLIYTGVGARKTPDEILNLMAKAAEKLAGLGWKLRSGGADGADKAFENGARHAKGEFFSYRPRHSTPAAEKLAGSLHPAWNKCSGYVRKLHGRNAFQVLGPNLDMPSAMLICWTPDGCINHESRSIKTGGTGTAISIASKNNVPVFNLARKDHRARVIKFINGDN